MAASLQNIALSCFALSFLHLYKEDGGPVHVEYKESVEPAVGNVECIYVFPIQQTKG